MEACIIAIAIIQASMTEHVDRRRPTAAAATTAACIAHLFVLGEFEVAWLSS